MKCGAKPLVGGDHAAASFQRGDVCMRVVEQPEVADPGLRGRQFPPLCLPPPRFTEHPFSRSHSRRRPTTAGSSAQMVAILADQFNAVAHPRKSRQESLELLPCFAHAATPGALRHVILRPNGRDSCPGPRRPPPPVTHGWSNTFDRQVRHGSLYQTDTISDRRFSRAPAHFAPLSNNARNPGPEASMQPPLCAQPGAIPKPCPAL